MQGAANNGSKGNLIMVNIEIIKAHSDYVDLSGDEAIAVNLLRQGCYKEIIDWGLARHLHVDFGMFDGILDSYLSAFDNYCDLHGVEL